MARDKAEMYPLLWLIILAHLLLSWSMNRSIILLIFRLEENSGAYVQFAAMYTNGNGERRIRTINYKF